MPMPTWPADVAPFADLRCRRYAFRDQAAPGLRRDSTASREGRIKSSQRSINWARAPIFPSVHCISFVVKVGNGQRDRQISALPMTAVSLYCLSRGRYADTPAERPIPSALLAFVFLLRIALPAIRSERRCSTILRNAALHVISNKAWWISGAMPGTA